MTETLVLRNISTRQLEDLLRWNYHALTTGTANAAGTVAKVQQRVAEINDVLTERRRLRHV